MKFPCATCCNDSRRCLEAELIYFSVFRLFGLQHNVVHNLESTFGDNSSQKRHEQLNNCKKKAPLTLLINAVLLLSGQIFMMMVFGSGTIIRIPGNMYPEIQQFKTLLKQS